MRIIPAIDLIDGKCVRLTKGDFESKKIYSDDPVDVAKRFEDVGLKYLHLVDLDGAKNSDISNLKVLEKIASKTSLTIDFGGGLRNSHDAASVFDAGAAMITVGSIAVSQPDLFAEWLERYGAERIILGADCENRKIVASGWIEKHDIDIIEFLDSYHKKGVTRTICTEISHDGMLQGPALALYKDILQKVKIDLVASGGISSIVDLEAVRETGCEGVIIGKAYYEGRISLNELSKIC